MLDRLLTKSGYAAGIKPLFEAVTRAKAKSQRVAG